MRSTTLAVSLAATLLLSACGGDDTSSGTSEPAGAGGETSAPAPEPAPEPLTKAELQAALATLDDLPTGYTADEVSEDDDSDFKAEDPKCQDRYDLLEDFGDDAEVEAEVAFAKEPATSLEQSWGTYTTSPDELSEQFAAVESVVSECPRGTIISTDGTPPIELTFKPISFPDLGDDSFAMNAEAEIEGLPVALTFAFVRVGSSVQSVFQGGLGESDPELVAKLAQLGVERLPKK